MQCCVFQRRGCECVHQRRLPQLPSPYPPLSSTPTRKHGPGSSEAVSREEGRNGGQHVPGRRLCLLREFLQQPLSDQKNRGTE
ncbi:hypothetical protein JZ751_011228 [Albula glossodonta]|uniref:Uncharacterized protein n=1 Tax=Albula glossodonta TaxID=121402 RepID=A0A8T2P7D5_9TELE|nr:hypothetical protein JZ751_011228 [Albula glossodonta]